MDDMPANVQLVEGVLRIAGYTNVSSTMDPNEVCSLHREKRFDLILLDLLMPGMNGFQVMEGLKEIERDGYLSVLVITAQPAHKLEALEAGAKDFISKPFDIAELRARVHNLLEVRLLHLATKQYSEALEETARALEASRERESALARETHRSLLPRALPTFENYSIRAFNNPTRSLGGDFYEFLPLHEGQWMGVLADASGKGMAAALLSSMTLGALNMEFRSGTEPHEVMQRVNRLLLQKSLPSQFVTLFLFVLNPDGTGRYISAGHTPVYVFRSASGEIETFESDTYMLGMFDFSVYRSHKFHLDKGDVLVVYSDGLTKAENLRSELFGAERLMEIIQAEARAGGLAVEREILKALHDFTEGSAQGDDITFVIVEKTS